MAEDIVRQGLSRRWTTYSPSSTIQITFEKAMPGGGYQEDDLIGVPSVIDYNHSFARLYNFDDGQRHLLTLDVLLERIRLFLEDSNYDQNAEDQRHLTEQIVHRGGFALTRVPLRVSGTHPDLGMRNRVFHPSLVGKHVAAADPTKPHSVYLIVQYVDVTDVMGAAKSFAGRDFVEAEVETTLAGSWTSTFQQAPPPEGFPDCIPVHFELEGRNNRVQGHARFEGNGQSFELECLGGFVRDRLLVLEYRNQAPQVHQEGALMLRLAPHAREMESRYVGYGNESDGVVTGHIRLNRG